MSEKKPLEKIAEEKRFLVNVLEALLFSSESSLPVSRIREVIPALTPSELSVIVEHLNEQYRETGRCFEIKEIAGGYQMLTLPEFHNYVEQLFQNKQNSRLTQKALETLAIVAYKQPITKHDMEEIRGVNVDGVVKTLLSRNLVTISGRAQAPGSPFLYKTTRKFLDYFGLGSLDDLPKLKEIEELIDLADEGDPFHETILKEIAPNELGMKLNGNGESNHQPEGEEANESG
jgi:segregation and condensation protein B